MSPLYINFIRNLYIFVLFFIELKNFIPNYVVKKSPLAFTKAEKSFTEIFYRML